MDKLKLLEITFQKLATNQSFIAYYLHQSALQQHKTQAEVMAALNCTPENYYKLALCQAPDPNRSDFTERVANIAGYAHIPVPALAKLIKNVAQPETSVSPGNPVFAFIQKTLAAFNRVIPSGITKAAPTFYRTALSACALLFLFMTVTARVDFNNSDFYSKNYSPYKDSVKHLCLQDNTRLQPVAF